MFGMGPVETNIVGGGMAIVLSFLMGKGLIKLRRGRHGREEDLIELSNETAKQGFVFFPRLLNKLAVRDFRGVFEVARDVKEMLSDSVTRDAHFDDMFAKRLPDILKDENRRMRFVSVYEGFKAANPAVAAQISSMINAQHPDKPLADKVEVLEKKLNGGKTLEESQAEINEKLSVLVENGAKKSGK